MEKQFHLAGFQIVNIEKAKEKRVWTVIIELADGSLGEVQVNAKDIRLLSKFLIAAPNCVSPRSD